MIRDPESKRKLLNRKGVVLILSTLFVGICAVSIVALAAQVPSAAGSGQCADTILTFSAVEHNSLLVTGIAQQHDVVTGLKTKIDVTCIRVVGNQARIGGTFVSGAPIGYNANDTIVFDVVDNGEGSKATGPDQFNKFHVDPCGCNGSFNTTFPSERGNIQVRGGS